MSDSPMMVAFEEEAKLHRRISELEAEIERLRGEIADWKTRWREQVHEDGELEDEIEKLREEVSYLNGVSFRKQYVEQCEKVDTLKAEIERLKSAAESQRVEVDGWIRRNGELRLEVTRLTGESERLQDELEAEESRALEDC